MASRLFSRLRQIVSLILAAWHSVIAIDAFPGTHVACAKAPEPNTDPYFCTFAVVRNRDAHSRM